jgi:hypothetical protein
VEDRIKFWINDLLEALESQVDEETVKRVLGQCGIACVNGSQVDHYARKRLLANRGTRFGEKRL